VTPAGALAPAELPEAAAALGLRVKPPVRRAADVPDVHQGWLMAIATGMVNLVDGRATAEDAITPDAAHDQLLAGWLEGLRLIYADLSGHRYPDTLRWIVLLTLEALLGDGPTQCRPQPVEPHALLHRVEQALRRQDALRMTVEEGRLYYWLAPANRRGATGRCSAFW